MHVVRWCGLAPAAHCQQYFYASPYFILHFHPENNLTFLFSSCYKWLEGFLHFNKWVLTECFCVHCTKLEAVAIGRVYFFFFNSSIVDLQCCVSFRCIAKYTHIYIYIHFQFSSVQWLSHVQLFATPMDCSTPVFPVHHLLPELAQTHVCWMPSNNLILCCPFLLLSSIFCNIRVFSKKWVLCIRWPKHLCFSFSISPFNEYSWLIAFRMDWFDLLAVQGTLVSILYHHSLKASILWCSALFIVQLSDPYLTTGKTIALTRRTFFGKEMSLLFTILSRLVITSLPRSKRLLISWLQSPSAVILEPKKIKSVTLSSVSPYICHEVMGPDAMILAFWMLSFKPTFSLSSFTFIKRLFSSSSLSAIRVVSSAYLK